MTEVIYHRDLAFTYITFARSPSNLELLRLEIATAFKSSRLPFVPYIGGGAFCTDLVRLYQNYYLNSSLGQRERNIDVFQKKILEYTYPWDESLTAQEFYQWVLSDESTSLFPEAFRLYGRFRTHPDSSLAKPYLSITYRALANSVHMAAHVYNDALEEAKLNRRTGDVLVVQRVNGFDAIAPLLSFLVQKDISFDLYSGDVVPCFDGYKLAIIFEGRVHSHSEQFYIRVGDYLHADKPAILMGRSTFVSNEGPPSYESLTQLPGLVLLTN